MKKVLFALSFIVLVGLQALAQTTNVTGTVTDAADGSPIPGVSVFVKGTTIGTVTTPDGTYTLAVPNDATTIVFSFVGMTTQEVAYTGQSTVNAVMQSDAVDVGEVMVVAYGTTTKEAFTGSAAVVGAKELETRAVTSAVQAIEGNATGVQVMSASGQPGSSPAIIIRGVGTLNGSTAPLYIVDGAQYEGGLSNINPEDIESMTILKDANSTALYGSRAANGVVVITTKSGKKRDGGLRVNVSASLGTLTQAVPNYDEVSPGEYYELMWEGYKNSLIDGGASAGDAAIQASAEIADRLAYNPFNVPDDQIVGTDGVLNPNAQVITKGLDWYDALSRTGQREQYSINVSGGNDKYDVYFSTSYLDEKGYVINSDYDRLTTFLKANFQPKKWLKLGGSANLTMSETAGPASRGTSYANPFFFAKSIGSIYPVWVTDPATGDYILDEAGERIYDLGEGYPEYGVKGRPTLVGRHTIAETLWNSDISKLNNLSTRYYADFFIIDGLKATLSYSIDVQDYINKEYENNIVGDGAPSGRYSEDRYRRTTETFYQMLSYNKRFDSGHNFDVTIGHESFDRHYSENSGMKNTQTASGIYEFDNFSQVSNLSGYSSDKRTEGYFARANYNYNDKYYISGSVRRDGSSVFNKDVRWGNFFSLGGSWRLDQETFIQDITFIDKLKLRASFGQVGQDNLGDFYISQPRYALYSNAGEPGIYWSDLGNNALTWETSESWDAALEFALFDRKIDGSIEYWNRTSSDLLYNVPLAPSNGLSEGPANIATMVNDGIEISIKGNLLRTTDFNWDLTVTASTLNSEITKIPDPVVTGSKRWAEGRSRYEYFIYDYAGVDPANGDALYYNWKEVLDEETELGTGKFEKEVDETTGEFVTYNDYNDVGKGYTGETSQPDLYGSIINDLSYKGFNLNFMFTYGIGGKILDYGYANMMHEGEYGESMHPDLLNGWRQPGDVTNVPRMENGDPTLLQTMSTRFLTDASYFAVKNVNLSYTFRQAWVKNAGIGHLKVFLVGENLFLKSKRTGLNPQYNLAGTPDGYDYNPSRVFSVGVNVSF
ncbi:SusC/RagA family TonB-linked outer membrane protein [Carboxylicivirga sp. A043]|uniref:SusC/RagA family TonB-linked outer membrane protein n=1 Tax=Carboxylicivirga litoralis TaxID=2816963 RepID=UPI0021CB37C4|nr:SusC/RagA family TonB-linked outer membrane protein [Carboxylicivirga sp. A043]MCU4157813.1 SusC/RagA family TonB-linked outer membrane protein [Carboxylicivirga sp. A043]